MAFSAIARLGLELSQLHSARDRLQAINPEVRLDLYETRLTSANALDILRPYDVIIDGTSPSNLFFERACAP
jgi:adenylyltransferase/sulfurtransferase